MTAPAASTVPLGLVLGVALDRVVADPRRGHPVAGFGTLATRLEERLYRDAVPAGVVHAAVLVGGATAVTRWVERRLTRVGRVVLTTVLTAAALGGTSLRREAAGLAAALEAGDLTQARRRLPALCGRDPSDLDAADLARATVESVAENTSDAVVGTLVWAAVLGPAGVVLHRSANTLDAMVGHRTARYRRFGTAAARLDDVVGWLPARTTALLTVVLAGTVGGHPADAWGAWRRHAADHPSPNAGPVEAAAAGALGVRLGGAVNRYDDHLDHRPTLGDGPAPSVADIDRAVLLSRAVSAGALVAAVTAALLRRGAP